MSIRIRTMLLACSAGCFLPGMTSADARIDYRATEGGGGSIRSFLIGHGKVRTDADAQTSVILEPSADTVVLLDHSERTYTRMGRAELEQLSASIGAAMSSVEQAMASLPPEMRDQMAGMMGDALPVAGAGDMVKVVATGQRAVVAGHTCTIYRTQVQGDIVNETCMGDVSAFAEHTAAERRTLDSALAMTQRLADALAQGPLAKYVDLSTFQAGMVPLRVTDIDGSTRSTSEFAGIDDSALPADTFAVPAGYTEQTLEMPELSDLGG